MYIFQNNQSEEIKVPNEKSLIYKGIELVGRNSQNWNEPIQENFLKIIDRVEELERIVGKVKAGGGTIPTLETKVKVVVPMVNYLVINEEMALEMKGLASPNCDIEMYYKNKKLLTIQTNGAGQWSHTYIGFRSSYDLKFRASSDGKFSDYSKMYYVDKKGFKAIEEEIIEDTLTIETSQTNRYIADDKESNINMNRKYGNDKVKKMSKEDENDFVVGNDKANRIYGAYGNDVIDARGGNDVVYAGSDDDIMLASGGNDILKGYKGIDSVIFRGCFSDYRIEHRSNYQIVTDTVPNRDGMDKIYQSELLQFSDGLYTIASRKFQTGKYIDGVKY